MKDMLFLPEYRGAVVCPDGSKVVYGDLQRNYKDNRFELHYYIFDVTLNKTFRLTQKIRAFNVRWLSNDSIALLTTDANNQAQIFLYEGLIGEGKQITSHPGGVGSFETFKDGFIFRANNPKKDSDTHKLGKYIHVEEEESTSALYYVNPEKALEYRKKIKQLSGKEKNQPIEPVLEISALLKEPLAITNVLPYSETNTLFLQCQSKDEVHFELDTSYFKIEFDAEKILGEYLKNGNSDVVCDFGKITQLALPKGSELADISPDGKKLLLKYPERDLKQYTQRDLWILDLEVAKNDLTNSALKKHLKCITKDLDRETFSAKWTKYGIALNYWNESYNELAILTESGQLTVLEKDGLVSGYSFSINENGWFGLVAGSPNSVMDVYIAKLNNNKLTSLKKITSLNELVADWDLGTVESIKWKSKDGEEIEGVLRKPSNFDPKKKYPLVFAIHGGPSASSPNILMDYSDRDFYPTIQLTNEDVLILKPNYRNSLGKGQRFHELGVDNLGIGEMWDIESAIDYLAAQGFVDESRIGAMGWSQGGFISAFLGMHSDKFKAVSCGAAVSSWYTFYISSDLRHSLNISDHPIKPGMKEIYCKTAPISGIANAKTPMLLQHGENDQRISVVSAKELHRSLKDKGVQTELFIFPGMGHGLNKPRESHAAMVQNYNWFMHHFFNKELDFHTDTTWE